jgi:hypothetical protein
VLLFNECLLLLLLLLLLMMFISLSTQSGNFWIHRRVALGGLCVYIYTRMCACMYIYIGFCAYVCNYACIYGRWGFF